MRTLAVAAVLLSGLASPAWAQSPSPMVGAHDPASLVTAMEMGGYKVELEVDSSGDPMIRTEFAGMPSSIAFYGCNQEHLECDSLMLMTGFDRETSWDVASAIKINEEVRFASVWLDDEGDPWISWDIATGHEGVPVGTFSSGLRKYGDTVDRVAGMVFSEERGE